MGGGVVLIAAGIFMVWAANSGKLQAIWKIISTDNSTTNGSTK